MSFIELLTQYLRAAFYERNKGDRFERLMQAWLLTGPRFAHVWLWNNFPAREELGATDTTINL